MSRAGTPALEHLQAAGVAYRLQVELSPADLATVTGATVAPIARIP